MTYKAITIILALVGIAIYGVGRDFHEKADQAAAELDDTHNKLVSAQKDEQEAESQLQEVIRVHGDLQAADISLLSDKIRQKKDELRDMKDNRDKIAREVREQEEQLRVLEEQLRASESSSEGADDASAINHLIQDLAASVYYTDVERLYQRRLLSLLPMIRSGSSVDVVLPNMNGTTALHNACGLSRVDIVRWLVNHGADLDARTAKGASVEQCVGGSNAAAISQILREARQRSTHADSGLTPFINRIADMRPADATMQLYQRRLLTLLPLISNGADTDVTLPETKGNTALHYACGMGYADLVQWLVEHGANINKRTNAGKTPLDCTGSGEARRIREILTNPSYSAVNDFHHGSDESGDPDELNNLGLAYQYGNNGKPQNYSEAARHFRLAAEQGHAGAQNNLGFCYHNGWGVPKDMSQAAMWYKRSADQGNAWGQSNYGTCLEFGWGVRKNVSAAIEMYRRAAVQGHASAKKHLKRHGITM